MKAFDMSKRDALHRLELAVNMVLAVAETGTTMESCPAISTGDTTAVSTPPGSRRRSLLPGPFASAGPVVK